MSFTIDDTTKQKNDPLNKLDEKSRKRVEHFETEKEINDVLKAGQEDRGKAIKEIEKQEVQKQKVEEVRRNDVLNRLDMHKQFEASYKRELAQALAQILEQLEWVKGWKCEVVITDGRPINIQGQPYQTRNGILLIVFPGDGGFFHKGMIMSRDPVLDYAKVYDLALQVENTMDKVRGLIMQSPQKTDTIVDNHGKPIKTTGATGS